MSEVPPSETTSLLEAPQEREHSSLPGPIVATTAALRVHFLDNLRAILTILLILHHSVLETTLARGYNEYTKVQILPFALFTAVDRSYLWSLFFFTSGYSTSLSLLSKPSDRHFFTSRTLKIGVPALLYAYGGHLVLFLYLAFGWERIFGSYKAGWAFVRLSGPIEYVAVLLLLDYIYLFSRWIGRRWPDTVATLPGSRFINSLRPTSRLRFYALVAFSLSLLIIVTYLSCIGIHLPPIVLLLAFPYDRPGPDVPLSYIIAYTTGVNFKSIKSYLIIRPIFAYATLFLSTLLACLSMGAVQHFSPPLWKFIEIPYTYMDYLFFIDGGFNLHTVFFTLWNVFVFFAISVSLISIFAQAHWATRDWGFWTRRIYPQTYINMIPILIAIYHLRNIHNIVIRNVLVGTFGVIGSWLLVMTPVLLWRVLRRIIRRYHRVLCVSGQ